MGRIYKNYPELNLSYKDGSRAKDFGQAITTNPFTISVPSFWAWIDGYNKTAIEVTPKRLPYTFNTGLTNVDPGLGAIGFQAAAFATVNSMRMNITAANGEATSDLIGTFAVGENIIVYNAADITNYVQFTGVSQNIILYATVALNYVASAGAFFSNGMPVIVQVG